MLRELKIRNFRGFADHQLPLKDLTVIVGKNNAGKTTLVEALRLLSVVVSRYKNLPYRQPPDWTNLPLREYGVSPSLRNLEINFRSIFHRYQEPPAHIVGIFENESSVSIYLSDNEDIYAVIRNSSGDIIKGKNQAEEARLPPVSIMPQVTPVQLSEKILTRNYVLSAMSSSLSSSHFRNQLNLLHKQYFSEFQRIVEDTWPGVKVMELFNRGDALHSELILHVRNEDFVGEVGLMGHGLQMWLQAMWFLTRSSGSKTIILDEPDVYMHPDLQRNVIRFLRNLYPQTILTTHSIEIMSEVDPENILIIDKAREKSDFATSLQAVQRITDSIGSVHNVHLARLSSSRRFLLVEGKDVRFLKHFQDILFPNSNIPIETIPSMEIGGWGGWNHVTGSSMTLHNATGENIHIYCLLDRDYHTQEEIIERHQKATELGINLHIWSQKEIENFFLLPSAVHQYISNRIAKRTTPPNIQEVKNKIESLASDMEDDVFDAVSNEYLVRNRRKGSSGANKYAREYMKPYKENGSLVHIVSGKSLLSKLSSWSQSEFSVQISSAGLIKEFHVSEINTEMKNVITAIEHLNDF